jgi:heavy metal sensor kinase
LRFNQDRLDRELRNLGAANLDRVVGDEHWRRVESALRFVSGADRPPTYALWVANYDREIYRSPNWPTEVAPEKLTKPTKYENGRTYDPVPPPPRQRDPISPANPALPRKEPYFLTQQSGTSEWRLGVMGSPYTTLVLAANLDEFNAELRQLRSNFLAALPVALLVVAGGAWFFAGRALRPIHALTHAAEGVTARGLSQRISVRGNDREFLRLVTVFNEMMDRLEKSFQQATRFSADASHELKTPLALLQVELEQALASTPAGSSHQQVYTSLLEDVQRLKAIIQKLLLLSLVDSGKLELHRVPVDLSALLANVIEDTTALAPGIKIEHTIPLGVSVDADSLLLEQALQNLAGNALKYNRPGGTVRFELKTDGDITTVTVGNTGAGISAEDRPRIFERFFRGDRARKHDGSSGVGLGLSLSREIIRAHGGDLSLGPAQDDWTTFIVTLRPVARAN